MSLSKKLAMYLKLKRQQSALFEISPTSLDRSSSMAFCFPILFIYEATYNKHSFVVGYGTFSNFNGCNSSTWVNISLIFHQVIMSKYFVS